MSAALPVWQDPAVRPLDRAPRVDGAVERLTVAPRWPEVDEAWVGVGSNLGDRAATIAVAIAALPGVVLTSPIVETEPWGIRDQPWFLNGVVQLRWHGTPRELLERCLDIEQVLGRRRQARNGPRLIDLDVLIAGRQRMRRPDLVVPHPGIGDRRSVLEPWACVAPELVVPGLGRTIAQLRRGAAPLPGQQVRAWDPRGLA